ncbi:MAG: hypothetical protein GX230_10890 [Lentisphaerae bacterium]|jgi:DNA-directed RNA polymerase subunit RPC12/RpoP|nr:hypothetical protein [Lentisphaerota bacterium]
MEHANSNEQQFISFRCRACQQEIEASSDMACTTSECPGCGVRIEIPAESEDGTLWGKPLDNTQDTYGFEEVEAIKSRTIRIELADDF